MEPNPPIYIFTHIHACGGVALNERLFRRNFGERVYQFTGYRRFMRDALLKPVPMSVVFGHVEFGVHWFLRSRYQYITNLREPLNRAVSYYNYLLQMEKEGNSMVGLMKDDLEWAKKCPVEKFYGMPRKDNWITRFLAGSVSRNFRSSNRYLLSLAKKNLRQHYLCGIMEREEETLRLFARKLSLEIDETAPPRQYMNRPNFSTKLADLPIAAQQLLREHHLHDLELYHLGLELFEANLASM